ncbi:MAG: transposase [Emticicia sp.]|nr:transposase [Emticicia sp.]
MDRSVFFASFCNNDQVGLVQWRLYLPQAWVDDKDRCNKAGIPKVEQVYSTKPDLAIEILKTIPSDIVYDWVGGDCIYGNSFTLRQYLYSKKQSFVLDVGEELGVYLTKPQLYVPPKKGKKGANPEALVCDDSPISLKKLIKEIPDENWETIIHK